MGVSVRRPVLLGSRAVLGFAVQEGRGGGGGANEGVVGSRVAHMWYTKMGVARCYACV
jgi:hypothetical protein